MYDGIEKGPVQRMTSSIKSSTVELLTSKWKDGWNITQISTVVRTLCLKIHLILLECLQTMDELDYFPNIEELSSAVGHLTNGKAAGSNNIPPGLIKTYKSALLLPLHEIRC